MGKAAETLKKCPQCNEWVHSRVDDCPHCEFDFRKPGPFSFSDQYRARKDDIDSRITLDGKGKLKRFVLQVGRAIWLAYMVVLLIFMYFVALFSG